MKPPATPTTPGPPETLPTTAEPRQRARLLTRLGRAPWVSGAAAAFLVVAATSALLAPALPLADPMDVGGRALRRPSADHWLGTDALGRDVLSRVVFGARSSLSVGLAAVAIAMSVGMPMGILAGYAGGWIDRAVSSVVEVMMAFPSIVLALVVLAVFGGSLVNVCIAVGLAQIPHYARQARGSALEVRSQEYVTAARALGAGDLRILLRHVLPNAFAPVLVVATMGLGTAILDAAGLSFLGLAGDPNRPEWGNMLTADRDRFRQQPWLVVAPGVAITGAVLSFNVLGDALRDWLDPRLAE